jgi:hypothetical protein
MNAKRQRILEWLRASYSALDLIGVFFVLTLFLSVYGIVERIEHSPWPGESHDLID